MNRIKIWLKKYAREISIISVEITISFGFIILGAILFTIFLVDINNSSNGLSEKIRYDWPMIFCTFCAGFSSAFLGIIVMLQNHDSREMNKKLAKINEKQLEISVINENYPSIKFCDKQLIQRGENTLRLKFYDRRDIPIKKVIVSDMYLKPYVERYKEDDSVRKIIIQKRSVETFAEFTPYHKHDEQGDGFYFANIVNVSPEIFEKYEYARLEFNIDVVSATGVVAMYRYRLLLERNDAKNMEKNRIYPIIYHQFYEYDRIMSEEKYKRTISS